MSLANYSNIVQPLLTDLYQISMAYAYWKNQKHEEIGSFDLFFRKNPFDGEYTIFAGLEESLKFIQNYHFKEDDIEYLRKTLPDYIEKEFYSYLLELNMNDMKIYALEEGSVVFPRVPLIRVEGPILKGQLLETTLLTLVNYASLVTTNAVRFRETSAKEKIFHEFGLRRAQGPDGGLTASKYCYLGGFDGTSNVLAGKLYGIPIKGTHAHSYVSSFHQINELKIKQLKDALTEQIHPFVDLCLENLQRICEELKLISSETNEGELSAFISYAIAFPTSFLALVDTYDVLRSGLPNFLAVACGLHQCNYRAIGLRLDSGDLAYLSIEVRKRFIEIGQLFEIDYLKDLSIVASNDINEHILISLEKQEHQIDVFGIGTHLVTCQKQPALGCVYKLVELNGIARLKLSQDMEKVTIPGRKNLYRLFGRDGTTLCDLLTHFDENPPLANERILCRHPFLEKKRAYVTPSSVRSMYHLVWSDGQIQYSLPSWNHCKNYCQKEIESLRKDHRRYLNPTPYKVSLSDQLFSFMHQLWMESVPIGELF